MGKQVCTGGTDAVRQLLRNWLDESEGADLDLALRDWKTFADLTWGSERALPVPVKWAADVSRLVALGMSAGPVVVFECPDRVTRSLVLAEAAKRGVNAKLPVYTDRQGTRGTTPVERRTLLGFYWLDGRADNDQRAELLAALRPNGVGESEEPEDDAKWLTWATDALGTIELAVQWDRLRMEFGPRVSRQGEPDSLSVFAYGDDHGPPGAYDTQLIWHAEALIEAHRNELPADRLHWRGPRLIIATIADVESPQMGRATPSSPRLRLSVPIIRLVPNPEEWLGQEACALADALRQVLAIGGNRILSGLPLDDARIPSACPTCCWRWVSQQVASLPPVTKIRRQAWAHYRRSQPDIDLIVAFLAHVSNVLRGTARPSHRFAGHHPECLRGWLSSTGAEGLSDEELGAMGLPVVRDKNTSVAMTRVLGWLGSSDAPGGRWRGDIQAIAGRFSELYGRRQWKEELSQLLGRVDPGPWAGPHARQRVNQRYVEQILLELITVPGPTGFFGAMRLFDHAVDALTDDGKGLTLALRRLEALLKYLATSVGLLVPAATRAKPGVDSAEGSRLRNVIEGLWQRHDRLIRATMGELRQEWNRTRSAGGRQVNICLGEVNIDQLLADAGIARNAAVHHRSSAIDDSSPASQLPSHPVQDVEAVRALRALRASDALRKGIPLVAKVLEEHTGPLGSLVTFRTELDETITAPLPFVGGRRWTRGQLVLNPLLVVARGATQDWSQAVAVPYRADLLDPLCRPGPEFESEWAAPSV